MQSPLRSWREEKALTQAVLAEELGVHVQYLSDIERGARPAGQQLLRKIRDRTSGAVTADDMMAYYDFCQRDAA